MKKTNQRLILALWVVFASFALTHLWIVNSSRLPTIPQPFAIWLVDLYGANNAEEIRDLEALLGLAVAFPLVLGLTYSGILIWQRIRNRTVDR